MDDQVQHGTQLYTKHLLLYYARAVNKLKRNSSSNRGEGSIILTPYFRYLRAAGKKAILFLLLFLVVWVILFVFAFVGFGGGVIVFSDMNSSQQPYYIGITISMRIQPRQTLFNGEENRLEQTRKFSWVETEADVVNWIKIQHMKL